MRIKSILLCVLITKACTLSAQKDISGNYFNHFGSKLEIHADSTFKYNFHIDTEMSWTVGKWKVTNDTIYFTMIPVYDTVIYKDSSQTNRIDSLVLSLDQIPEKIISLESISGYLTSFGQNRHSFPDKLFYKRNKLFYIVNGKLKRDRVKSFWTQKKYVPWFKRI